MPKKTWIDRHYNIIRKFRFLYGWAKDATDKTRSSARGKEWAAKGYRDAKLDICGGRYPYKPDEYLNVDIVALPKVDVVFDITKRFPIDDDMITEVFSAHTLEHLRKDENIHVLKEAFRVLKPGGLLRVATPSIEAICKGVLEDEDYGVLSRFLWGNFKDKETEIYDVHRWMFKARDMRKTLEKIGYESIEQVPPDDGMHDPKYCMMFRARKPSS